MTVTNTQREVEYTGDGSQTVFSFSFPAFDESWIEAWVTEEGLGGPYTVAINSNQNSSPGGSVTFSSPPLVGETVHIERIVPLTQLTDYLPYTRFPSRDHEEALDKLTMIAQQFIGEVDSLGAVEISTNDPQTIEVTSASLRDGPTLTAITNVANGLLKLDADGSIPSYLVPVTGGHEFSGDNPSIGTSDAAIIIGTTTPEDEPYIAAGPTTISAWQRAFFPGTLRLGDFGGVAIYYGSSPQLLITDDNRVRVRRGADGGANYISFENADQSEMALMGFFPGLLDLRIANIQDGGAILIRATTSAGVTETLVDMSADDEFVSIRNTLTGSGLERALTKGDLNEQVHFASEGDIVGFVDTEVSVLTAIDTGRVYSVDATTQGLDDTPDTIKLNDGRYANKVREGYTRRIGTFSTGDYGHLCGSFTYNKRSKTEATLLTDLSAYKSYTRDHLDYPGISIAYVDWAKGNDNSGDGLSWATAKASIYAAISLNPDIVLIRAGTYNRVNRLNDFTVNKDMAILPVGGKVVCGCLATGTWSKTAGYANIYQLDYAPGLTNVTNAVFDTQVLENRAPMRYTSDVADLTELDASPGKFTHDSGTDTTYVHAADSRDLTLSGDTLRLTQPVATPIITFAGDYKLYIRDYENWGGSGSNSLKLIGDGSEHRYSVFFNENCVFAGSIDGGSGNGLAVNDIGLCVSVNSSCLSNRRDGFNYHNWLEGASGVAGMSPHFIELNCESHGNGLFGSEGNNQGSTAHEEVIGFRLGGDYSGHPDGGCVVDIDASKVYMVCNITNDSSRVGALLSCNAYPDGDPDSRGRWWIDGHYARNNNGGVSANARGDIAMDGFRSELHMIDCDTEQAVSTRTFTTVIDDILPE